ncbi:type III-A CRISPR-associated protein Cas10/Csm1 [Candidatus Poribacteria bacterium]|nr:type III-A CRISPR-associated protein Cas10/Csm1 [Candidatus Poribacteria bacterium]
MDRTQIAVVIDGLSQHLKGKTEVSDRLKNAFKHCSEHGKGKARLIKGDLSGIQTFIYNVNRAEDVDGGVAKRLRGRSFYLSAFCLAMAEELRVKLGLPKYCRLSWSGGKFLLMVPESKTLEKTVWEWKEKIDDWLWGEFWGDLFLNLAISEALTPEELNAQYIRVSQCLQNQLELHKLMKFDKTLPKELTVRGGECKANYRDRVFDTGYVTECHSCRELPRMGDKAKEKEWKENLCCVCNELEDLASYKKLPLHPYVVCGSRKELKQRNLWNDKNVQFHNTWAVLFDEKVSDDAELVPAYSPPLYGENEEERKRDELCDRACTLGAAQQVKGKANCENDRLATRFHCLAALVNDRAPAKGNKKIAVMAGDVDYLSVIMNSIHDMQLEQAVVLSELIYRFFADEMIKLLERYEIYLAYSGGDDFVVIGAWDRVLDFACELSQKWDGMMPAGDKPMECLTFSAGVQITNPQYPIYEGITQAQDRMKNAKENGRNRIDVMKVVMEWKTYRDALEKAKWLKCRIRDEENPDGPITIGFMYKMYDILEQYKKWSEERDRIGLQYPSQLTTHIQRNVAENQKGDEVKKFLQPLLKFNDETLLPHFRFILDWVVLMKRD